MGREAPPVSVTEYPHVGVAQCQLGALSLLDADQVKGEPDDGGVAEDLDGEVVLDGLHDLLVKSRRERELLLVGAAPVLVGRHELVGEDALDDLRSFR